MSRFRLRFLLQEFDLAGPEIVIGRSSDCHITIEDPLISRRHASVTVGGGQATLNDLGSRNGVRVNGRLIQGSQVLSDGERIGIGAQELLFSVVRAETRAARQTGYLKVCRACRAPYPEVAPQCPHCGEASAPDEDTMSGVVPESNRSWTFQLLGEVIARAIGAGKAVEAERLMRRAAEEVDERLAIGARLDADQASMIALFALRLAKLIGGSEWPAWALRVHRRQAMPLTSEALDALEALDFESFPEIRGVLSEYAEAVAAARSDAPESVFARLEALTRA